MYVLQMLVVAALPFLHMPSSYKCSAYELHDHCVFYSILHLSESYSCTMETQQANHAVWPVMLVSAGARPVTLTIPVGYFALD